MIAEEAKNIAVRFDNGGGCEGIRGSKQIWGRPPRWRNREIRHGEAAVGRRNLSAGYLQRANVCRPGGARSFSCSSVVEGMRTSHTVFPPPPHTVATYAIIFI